jgi:crossover junction endodeoxyribonuclease RusA
MLEIVVYGLPAPQGSKKFVGVSKGGRGILIEQSKRVRPWRDAVKAAALAVMGAPGTGPRGPVMVEMIFTMPKPKSAPKRRRTYPDRTPDLSKLVRATEDALTDVGAWEDDARVINCTSGKVFPGEDSASLLVPGAVIRIKSIEEYSRCHLNAPTA